MNFSKDMVLKSDGIISFFPNHFFLLKIAANICLAALSMTCVGLHDALTYADMCSNLGHPSESLRWATLRGIRSFYKKKK